MKWQTFLAIWWLIGCASTLNRNRYIWQEEKQGHRFLLIVLMFPTILTGFAVGVTMALVAAQWRYMHQTWKGIDPDAKEEAEGVEV